MKTITLRLTTPEGDELLYQELEGFAINTEPDREPTGVSVHEQVADLMVEITGVLELAGARPVATPTGLKLLVGEVLLAANEPEDALDVTVTIPVITENPHERD